MKVVGSVVKGRTVVPNYRWTDESTKSAPPLSSWSIWYLKIASNIEYAASSVLRTSPWRRDAMDGGSCSEPRPYNYQSAVSRHCNDQFSIPIITNALSRELSTRRLAWPIIIYDVVLIKQLLHCAAHCIWMVFSKCNTILKRTVFKEYDKIIQKFECSFARYQLKLRFPKLTVMCNL